MRFLISKQILQKLNSCSNKINVHSSGIGIVIIKLSMNTSSSCNNPSNKNIYLNQNENINKLRNTISPWIKIGEYQKGLMSHLSIYQILRSLFVLKLCTYDFIVDNSMKFIQIYKKLGILGEWPLRKTFYNQFVGGDTIPCMTQVVHSMQKRGIKLMFCPVLEEDIEHERSPSKFYDDNFQCLMDLIVLTSSLEKNKPILQLKPTAIIPAITLEKISKVINMRCKYSEPLKLSRLVDELAKSIENPNELKLNMDKIETLYFFDGLRRADILVKKAKERSVHIIVDAEFYSCKPAISAITLALMARHNSDGHYVGNTIQAYFKEALSTIKAELETITMHIGVNWYGKIVRGAYMDRENYLAKKYNYTSPIWDTYEETNQSYNASIQHVLEHMNEHKKTTQTHLVVASHNEISIRLATQKMKELNMTNQDKVSFAQIYGMADYLSTPLVQQGYNVYKSTPFGPIENVLPYLARRASENRSVMKGTREERYILKQELKQRFSMKK